MLSRNEVIVWLEEAGATLLMLPIPKGGKPSDYRVQWPDMVWRYWEALGGLTPAQVAAWERERNRTKPINLLSPERIDRMDECLDWLYRIQDNRHRKVVSARMLVNEHSGRHLVSWARLSRELGIHRDTVRNWFEKGIEDILTFNNRRG